MRVVVTGGLGFLGRAVVAELVDTGMDVGVLARQKDAVAPHGAHIVYGDLRDRERTIANITLGRYEAVVHLAGLAAGRDSVERPLDYWNTNVCGTLNVLAALQSGLRLVFASSNIVYGSRAEGGLAEDLEPHPESPYADTKVAGERAIEAVAATGAIAATSLRFFNIAGASAGLPDIDSHRIIPNVFRAVTGELPHVTVNGDGGAVRDFVHVTDCAVATRLAVERAVVGEYRVFNVGSGVGTSMADVVAVVGEVVDRPVPVALAPAKREPRVLVADISRAARQLGWKPERSDVHRIITDAWSAWRAL